MWKLVVATLALSTACLALPPWRGASLGDFSKIKSLSSFSLGAKELYPGDNTDGEAILHALAAIQDPVTLEKVKNVLKEHAAKLYERVVAAEAAFAKVRDSVGNSEAKALLTQVRLPRRVAQSSQDHSVRSRPTFTREAPMPFLVPIPTNFSEV